MGSLFSSSSSSSSPAPPPPAYDAARPTPEEWLAWFSSSQSHGRAPHPPAYPAGPTAEECRAVCKLLMNRKDMPIRSPEQREHDDAIAMLGLANWAIKHYSSNHPGAAEFHCPSKLTKELELKAACVGFRKDLWYHINFLARQRGGDDVKMRRFFAELHFEPCSDRLIVETCTVLEEPWSRFRSICAFCPDESNILHPSDPEFKCGKQGHDTEFFHDRCGMDGRTKASFGQSDMLRTPLMVGAPVPRYRLDYVEE